MMTLVYNVFFLQATNYATLAMGPGRKMPEVATAAPAGKRSAKTQGGRAAKVQV